jgi:hypothetical protein
VYDNSIEGHLDQVISVSGQIHTSLQGDIKDQRQFKDAVSLLALEINNLALIVQIMATKQKMMSDVTPF